VARIVLVLAIIGALVLVGAGRAGAQDDAATDQRVVRLVGDYDVKPDLGRIDVVEEITVSNVRGSTRSGNTVTSYFWTGHTVWAPTDAENLSISVEGNELEWEVAETISGIDIISADYRRNLNFGQTRVIDVTYTLPTYAPDIGGRRINEAFFDFELVTCCGFEEVDLTVSIPADFAVTPSNSLRFSPSTAGGQQVYTFSDNEVTGQFTELIFTDWSGFNEAGMERSTATVDGSGASVDLIYPPDDQAWADETSADLAELGTALEELIGAPFPQDGLVFRQGSNDAFDQWGVGGPFDETLILPRDYDERGLATTLAHAWLADGPFTDGVVRDGLAYEFASEAIVRTGGRPGNPTEPGGGAALSPEGRQWVMRQVSDEIGYDGLGELVAMAAAGETAYLGSGDPEAEPENVATIGGDWRRFVDLAEQRLGSERAVPVFTEHVVGAVGVGQLEDRADLLDRIERLDRDAGGVIPVGIRTAMTNWEFEEAEALVSSADDVIDERDRVIGDDAERAADDQLALGEEWASAESAGDLEQVRSAILDRESALDRQGLIRIVLIGLGVLVLLVAVVAAVLLRRRKASGSAETSSPSGPLPGPGGGQVPVPVHPVVDGPPAAPFPAPGTAANPAPVAPVPDPASMPVEPDPGTWAPPVATPGVPVDATTEVTAPFSPPQSVEPSSPSESDSTNGSTSA